MFTEDQAKAKWCPEVRAGLYGSNVGGRDTTGCIGSACMMWRWFDPEPLETDPPRRGYCGLAGKPA